MHSALTPLLCLPGLTRNSKDFETIAPWLAQTRRVIALDFRGRGLSQYAGDPVSYRPDIELVDVISLLSFLKIDRVAIAGTSRGGIVGMLMAAFFRDKLAGLFLNDVGPELDSAGLLRIRSYLGVQREFSSWEMAIANLKSTNTGFESLGSNEWQAFARRVFKTENGLPRIDYDPALLQTFPTVEDITAGRVANLWEFFGKIEGLPVSVVRGEHSDLLSAATVAAMKQKITALDAATIPQRGHAPFLDETLAKDALARWLARVDAKEKGR
ncbi:MAG: alpha/beta hydrolase [Aestuariivirga sp.]